MIEKTGIPSREQVMDVFPDVERINKGPVAVIECYKEIPCNPCTTSCKFNAIYIGDDINKRPDLSEEKCIGCGVCLSKCPGLAIMVVDGSKSSETVDITIPYEFLPLPKPGEIVDGLDRSGAFIAKVKIIKVLNPKSYDRTPLVTASVDRKYLYDFRNIRLEETL
ncbi:MAG: 4Fe-4S dicluster domain-containing protein [Tissierellales bacterium]|jgi:Fe-S-cluster-containing hydrogenase component 2|nr:4Fe-4S dicluster domain-containing protein [Tissierellales bacterium]MBN2826384.1 4Fe-4S dicluster domain-containing protein [Tissierellales bacterium]